MSIVDMNTLSAGQLEQAAAILSAELPLGWTTQADAMAEIRERLIPENTLLAAVDEDNVVGWAGILPVYRGKVFELHPLVVTRTWQRRGIGRRLVDAIEQAARSRGGLTMWLGADDERPGGETSLANVDLYDQLPQRIADFKPGTHQSAFYQKMGYTLAGVLPDANGPGKPDLFFAKRLF